MNTRHITRFTYKFTNFQGWRVAITRQGVALARYFSDKQYGDAETAREQAYRFRDMVLAELNEHPEQTQAILMKHRIQPGTEYPAGLKPAPTTAAEPTKSPACSMRSNKVLHSILRRVCKHLQLDTASVLKLSLYLFTLQYGAVSQAKEMPENAKIQVCANSLTQESTATHLQNLVEELEQRARRAGLPSFEEFSTGRCNTQPPLATLDEQPEKQLPPQSNDIATYDNSHAAERYMRSPRPSPPQTFDHHPSPTTHTTPLSISQPAATDCQPPHTAEASLPVSHNTAGLAHGSTQQHFASPTSKRRRPPAASLRHPIPLL